MTDTLITADIGNVGTKYRRAPSYAWVVEPSLVRAAGPAGYAFVDGVGPKALTYESGPAQIAATPVYVGSDAQKHGTHDLALVGSAQLRVRSDAYLLLHLYAILASLPAGVTNASVAFAGGLPVMDAASPGVAELLRNRLKGTHTLRWGETRYHLTITRVLLIPQPIGAVATLLFHSDGKVRTNGALTRTRFVIDIGGGTVDYTGRVGLELIPGSEGGARIGVIDAARRACELIQVAHPRLRNLSDQQVLATLRGEATIGHQGDVLDVQHELAQGVAQTAQVILAEVLPRWERTLAQGEVLICGGGGALMAGAISTELGAITRVTLLDQPLFRIADGIERLAKSKLS